MGVSTGQWRAALGRWAGARGVTLCCFGEYESSRPPGFFGLVLAALLLVSGVEPNPGPVDKSRCELCGALLAALSEEVEKRERAVSEKEKSLLQLETKLQEKDRQLMDKQRLLESRMNQVQERENDVKEREVVLEKKEGVLAKWEGHISVRESQILERESQTSKREGEISEREGQISGRESQISGRESLVSSREALISVREKKILGRESVVSQREGLLREECKALFLKKGSLLSECSSVDSDSRSSISEQVMGEPTVHTEESGGDAVPPSPEVLLAAAAAGRLEDVRACLEEGRVLVDCRDEHGGTLLLLAASNGHLSVVRYLVSGFEAEVFARDKDRGRTALHCSAQNGHFHVVRFFVKEAGVNINTKTTFHETALHLAVGENKMDVVRFLVRDGNIHADIKNKNGQTALHLAVINNNMGSLYLLLEEGKADVSVGHEMNKTALHIAARRGTLNAVSLMVEVGKVDFRGKDKHWGHSILAEAAGEGHLSVVRFLVEQARADPNARRYNEPTALHKAVIGQHLEVVIYLVEAGASLTVHAVYSMDNTEYLWTPAQLTTSPAIQIFLSGAK